jgi:hypothetical protein
MSARAVTVGGFVLLAAVVLVLYAAGRGHRLGLAPLGDVLDQFRSPMVGRFALLAAWAWAGWHLLAR